MSNIILTPRQRVTVFLEDELYHRARETSRRRGKYMTDFISDLVAAELDYKTKKKTAKKGKAA